MAKPSDAGIEKESLYVFVCDDHQLLFFPYTPTTVPAPDLPSGSE